MRILFALPGLHRYDRGAEVAFISIASQLAKAGVDVTLMGSGEARPGTSYNFRHVGSIRRERLEALPSMPVFRSETIYEEASFAAALALAYKPGDFDLTVTCSYPFTNWLLRRPALGGKRPPHIFVTQNGDWPAYAKNAEYRLFGCDGLVCINPDFYERNRDKWRSALIPNGVDLNRFRPGVADRTAFGLPEATPLALMVSALIPSKRVADGIRAASRIPGLHLVVAGDGPERADIEALADQLLPGRFTRVTVAPERMPGLYRTADVFLHLSREESFGNVFVEALACGLPIVGHDSPRLRWIVGDEQFLLDTDDSSSVAQYMSAALAGSNAGYEDRVQRAAMFSWEAIGERYRAFFNEVVTAYGDGTA
jgi:glycosyltransferase involved in cell wall biosynthesis